jgi:glycosyltransferase involved in cell wall biosynthesis
LKKKNKEVLIVTRLDETQKNVSFALKVWKILQKKGLHGWSLIIVGHGPDEVFLKKIVKKYRLSNVSFEGKQMPIPYYETASIFMMTSDFEGWGMTLTESQQMGVVPIARDSYLSLHDIITNGYNGCIVKNNDIEAYADKLQWLMANDEERKQIALNGLKSAQRFTSDKIADRWVEMMESL